MLEGPAERAILRAGQWCADIFAYRRINRKFAKFARSYIKHSNLTRKQVQSANLRAAKEALLVRRRPNAFSSLRFYALARQEDLGGFVDDVEYWRSYHRNWGGRTRSTTDAKTLSRKLIGSDALPDVGYFVSGRWFDINWKVVDLSELLSSYRQEAGFALKADFSERGKDVEILSAAELLDPSRQFRFDSVLQRKVEQHAFFDELSQGRDCSIRMVTAFWPTETMPRLLSALVKWDVLGSGPVTRIKIDIETGSLVPPITLNNWRLAELPSSFKSDETHFVPGFSAAHELLLELHSKSPHYQLIGWDLIVDPDLKPWIFEWNADHPAIFTAQVLNGPILRDGVAAADQKRSR